MTDEELAIALYAEGIRPGEIAEKLEVSAVQVRVWLGVNGGRPRTVEKAILSTMTDGMTPKQIAAASGINPHNIKTYVGRLVRSGALKREPHGRTWMYSRVRNEPQP